MNQNQIGKFIAELRKNKHMTQAELGEKLGVTNKTVSRWENGNYMPDLSLLAQLARDLGHPGRHRHDWHRLVPQIKL